MGHLPSGDLSTQPAWHQCRHLSDSHMLPLPIWQLQTCPDLLSQMQLESIRFQNDLWIIDSEAKWLKRLKKKNHSLHNYVGTGTIWERYATTVDYLMYSFFSPYLTQIVHSCGCLHSNVWKPLQPSEVDFQFHCQGFTQEKFQGQPCQVSVGPKQTLCCSSEMICPSSVNWRLSLNANTFEWGCRPKQHWSIRFVRTTTCIITED